MPEKKEQIVIWAAIFISVIAIVAVVILATRGRQSAEDVGIVYHHEHPASESSFESTHESSKMAVKPAGDARMTLEDIIRARRGWNPIYSYWFGREAPDFILTDINGKQHRLSDYRGKDVMLIFWATWCGPCIVEVPHLIALRNLISEDELAMLAISYKNIFLGETAKKVKNFVTQNKINYTVFFTDARAMPFPFSRIRGVPTTFFIDKQGKIKLVAEGTISLGEIRAVLQAEE